VLSRRAGSRDKWPGRPGFRLYNAKRTAYARIGGMTDVQILTIAIAFAMSFLAVLVGVLLNNTRLGDLRASLTQMLDAKIGESRAQFSKDIHVLEAKIAESRTQSSIEIAEVRTLMADLRILIEKNHSEMLLKLSDMDGRLNRIESERRIIQ
jgi:hypothetical protein